VWGPRGRDASGPSESKDEGCNATIGRMNGNDIARRAKGASYIIAINCAVFAALFLLVELAMHVIWPDANPLLGPPFVASKFRVAHPVYGHTFRPNYEGDEHQRRHEPRSTVAAGRKRVLFVGDSFTEGVGVPYEGTFVGRFGSAFPNLDVLNAG